MLQETEFSGVIAWLVDCVIVEHAVGASPVGAAPPLDVQVTVVVPFGKNDPEAGEQVIVPHVPVEVGAG